MNATPYTYVPPRHLIVTNVTHHVTGKKYRIEARQLGELKHRLTALVRAGWMPERMGRA
jgi:hypothetical protein